MWSRGVIVLLTLTAAALAFDRDVAKERVTEYRIRSQNLHIDELEEELGHIEEAFNKLSEPIEDSEIARVKARLRRLGVQNCAKNEVSCGGDYPECVHNLLVCDGIKDCHNGNDEDEKVCDDSVVRVGSTFSGVVHWTSCVEQADHVSLITITAMHRSDYFGSRAWVRATITREVGGDFQHRQHLSYTAKGYFTFANRKLVLIPGPDAPHRFGVVCDFKFGDGDHAACRAVQEASLHVCAKFRVVRS